MISYDSQFVKPFLIFVFLLQITEAVVCCARRQRRMRIVRIFFIKFVQNNSLSLNALMFSRSAIYCVHGYEDSTAEKFAELIRMPFVKF